MKVSEQLKQMQLDLRGLAIWLAQEDECPWSISTMEAVAAVQKLRYAFDHNYVGESEAPPPAADRE